jgi:regulator of cell morphogenesis and NO signaling
MNSIEKGNLSDLIAHIVQSHHRYTRDALTLISGAIADLGAEKNGDARGVIACFHALQADLAPHLMKEERILFPYIRALEVDHQKPPMMPFDSVANPVRMMQFEHEAVKGLLSEIRDMTGNYRAPAGSNLAELYALLAGLDADLVRHIYLEDDVLFTRALEL